MTSASPDGGPPPPPAGRRRLPRARGPLGAALLLATLTGCLAEPPPMTGGVPVMGHPVVSHPPHDGQGGSGQGGSGSATAGAAAGGPPSPVAGVGETAPPPARLLDLSPWKLTLPLTSAPGAEPGNGVTAVQVRWPALRDFVLDPYFAAAAGGEGVRFRAPVEGATTPGSSYPRSELREMTRSGEHAAWSSTSGVHVLFLRQAITNVPSAQPKVVAGQIHDGDGYVLMIRLEGDRLFVQYDGQDLVDLDTDYRLGEVFTVRLVVADGMVAIEYNHRTRATIPLRRSGLYFKAGCYTQSNLAQGDPPGAYGEVVLYDARVWHG
ncbi:polysaccharide lyase family 7 protein [Frankia sp. CNm7]|uniref:Polysaccharide lyase family 7 protein n=1 Tax=Frankia nepalensis TaxID=1836974 RepID=A0A937UN49_9ACTN|nr:polysaccharide lyase family 7 protein [Frankia nepalensis]MBL7495065.1 polysaccharide lyase family 7 protein [Frankia nepalensis]MBL7513165.1 polysaccharide lyase family 7 protein [Frankia nepalensis]MBL7522264.1 polysaccharide lyase family 7 protein [Frankia nepalensis]MBL7629504.1 polysaccharide lyase family 7 protein [Frankia nepalensis]